MKQRNISEFQNVIERTSPSTTLVPMLMKNKFKKKTTEAVLPKTVPEAIASMRKTDKLLVLTFSCFFPLKSSTGTEVPEPDVDTKAAVSLSSLAGDVVNSKETVGVVLESEAFGGSANRHAVKKPTKDTAAAKNLFTKSMSNRLLKF
jgi:hypothetical protein